MAKGKERIFLFTEASIHLADDPDLSDSMVSAGFDTVFIGFESPDEMNLAECHKTQNKNRDLKASRKFIVRDYR